MTPPCSDDPREGWSLPPQQRVFLVVLLLVFLGLYWTRIHGGFLPSPKDTTPSFFDPDPFVVDVQGSVGCPGIYTFPSPVKARDVLLAARVNRKLSDEADASIRLKNGTTLVLAQVDGGLSFDIKPMDAAKRILYGVPFDLNRARADDLTLIPGIGPALAKRIVDYRDAEGQFNGLEDLLNVSGIGRKKIKSLRRYLSVENGLPPNP